METVKAEPQLKVVRETHGSEVATRVRQSLPGQKARETLDLAQATFGMAMKWVEVEQHIRAVLPALSLWQRLAHWQRPTYWQRPVHRLAHREWRLDWHHIEQYTGFIPDAALERYEAAFQSGHFSNFIVIEAHLRERAQAIADPWLVGRLKDTNQYIVLAYWD